MEQGLLPMPGLSAQSSETPDGGPDMDYDMVAEPEVVIDDGEIDRKWINFSPDKNQILLLVNMGPQICFI